MKGKRKQKHINEFNIDKISFSNEIKLIRRTLENNTHEVYEDLNIKKITSWRKSQNKFMKNLIYNILSFGILHLISIFHPKLYIKLYCNPSPAKECDYFLIENIYGEAIICPIQKKRGKYMENDLSFMDKNNLIDNINIKSEYNNNFNNLKYSFEYKSVTYEYDEKNNEVNPVYMNLTKMTNEGIINFFSEGLPSKKIVENLRERFGKNEYKLNVKIYLLFFLKNQIPSYVIVMLIEIIEFNFLFNYINLVFKLIVVAILVTGEILNIKINIINKYEDEFTLDGKKKKVKVKRKYLLKEENNTYTTLDIIDLLPGDIIFLKQNDHVPCDCIIFEGECLASQGSLTGNLDICKKIPLRRNNKYFNYKYSNINILYHGMEIIRTYSKNDQGYIAALSINTGANTMKANQYSNILYFLTKKSINNSIYNFLGERKRIFIYMVISFVFITILGYFGFNTFINQKTELKMNLPKYIIPMICKSLMTYYFIAKNIIIFINVIQLYKANITCFDQSRLINLGKINKFILNKTETLSNKSLSINGYHPITFGSKKKTQTKFIHFSKEQSKELNTKLLDYYQNYLNYTHNNSTFLNSKSKSKNIRKDFNYSNNNINNKSEENITLFLECLLSCNSIDNYNFELFGNKLETELFKDMKWDIKQYEENNNNNTLKIKFFKDLNHLDIGNNNSNEKYYYVIKKITDIFPTNYYKLGESSNNGLFNTSNNLSFLNETNNNTNLELSSSDNDSFKLRIFKRYIFNEGLFSAAIVYNFFTNELRFMIKGKPEEIINKCENKTIPNNLEKIISFYRKRGYIVLACGSKLLNISNYEDKDEDLEFYMDDLTFCGLLTLENTIKDNVKNSIEVIQKYNDDILIVSGDNEYNCLSIGYRSGIIDDKNIFILDKDEKNNGRITITKISSIDIKKDDESENDISKYTANDQLSRIGTSVSKSRAEKNDKENNNYNKLMYMKTNKMIDETINNIELNIPDLNKRKINQKNYENKIKKRDYPIINENSEAESIIKRKPNRDFSMKLEATVDNNKNKIKKTNRQSKENIENISKNINNISQGSIIEDNLNFMDKYYYQISFKDYEDIKNGIFCISGKLFNYMYKIKERKGAKKFMNDMIEKCKIYFGMSSIDKSCLIDYLNENPNNIVCTIGQCENDIDSIIESNVGINLKNPINKNTILCHFYSSKNDIICAKDIMEIGRLFFENINILEYISFLYSITINSFIFCCFLRETDIPKNELDFLEIELYVLLFSSFISKINKENIYINQKSKIVTIYDAILFAELLIIKITSFYLFAIFFTGDRTFDRETLSKEFISFYFILCSEYILSCILAFNFGSFYKENPLESRIFIILSLFYIAYITLLTFLCSSNMSYDIFNITFFAHSEALIDSYTDKNKAYLILTIIVDIVATIIFCSITKLIFKRYLK